MRTLTLWLILLFPVAALAADGDHLNGCEATKGNFYSACYYLCDADTDGACSEFDLNTVGIPEYITFSRDSVPSCSGNVTIGIDGQSTTGGTEHLLTTLNDATTSATVQFPTFRFIDADVANTADCTDIEVIMQLWFSKKD